MSGEAPDASAEGFAQYEVIPPGEEADSPAVYSNFVQATVSPFDLTIHFGWYAIPPLTERPQETVPVPVRAMVKVTVPLNLVRGMIQLLQAQLNAWQVSFGQAAPDVPQPIGEERRQQ